MKQTITRITVFCTLYCLLIFFGCGEATIQSSWRNQQLTIDGSDNDWGSSLLLFEKEKIAVGIANDDMNLYLCIKCMDRQLQQQIVRIGLTIWVDSSGSDNKIFGIHFPVGIQPGDMPRRLEERVEDENGDEPSRESQHDLFRRMYEMEVMGGENMVLEKFQNLHPSGMQLAISDSTGPIIYELKIPFQAHPGQRYAVGTQPGKTIGIGFETGELRRRASRPEMSEEAPGGGGGGRRRGMGGGMRGGGNRPENDAERLNLWAKIHLATQIPAGQ